MRWWSFAFGLPLLTLACGGDEVLAPSNETVQAIARVDEARELERQLAELNAELGTHDQRSLSQRLRDAEKAIAGAKTDSERKRAEAELQRLRRRRARIIELLRHPPTRPRPGPRPKRRPFKIRDECKNNPLCDPVAPKPAQN